MELNSKNIRKILLIITFAVLLYVGVQHVNLLWIGALKIVSVLRPFIIGLVLAFVLNVIMRPLEGLMIKLTAKRKKGSVSKKIARITSLSATILLTVGVVALMLVVIIPALRDTLQPLKTNLPIYADKVLAFAQEFLTKYDIGTDFLEGKDFDWGSIISKLASFLTSGSNSVLSSAAGMTASVVSKVSNMFIGFIFCVYILSQKEKLGSFIRRLARLWCSDKLRKRGRSIVDVSNATFTNFVTSKGIEALILGVLCFIGMLILRIPYAGVSSLMIAVMSFIPYIGSFLSAAVSAFLILMTSPFKALVFIIFFVVLQAVEGYLIYPRVIGKSVGLPGLIVLLSVIVGSSISGIVGMLVAVPVASVLFAMLKEFIADKEREKNHSGIKRTLAEKIFEGNDSESPGTDNADEEFSDSVNSDSEAVEVKVSDAKKADSD